MRRCGHRRRLILLFTGLPLVAIVGVTVGFTANLHDSGPPPVALPPSPSPSMPSVFVPPVTPTFVGWPDASNTGVPANAGDLQLMGHLTVTKDGARFSRLDIRDCVDIEANDVVITQSVIHCDRAAAAVRIAAGAKGAVLDQVEIDGGGSTSSCIAPQDFTIEQSNLHDCVDGVDFSSKVVIDDCYIHDLARTPGSHNDSLQTLGGADDLIEDNTLQAYRADTNDPMNSAIQTGHLNTPLSDVTVEHNYMDGGNFTVNAGATSTNGHAITGYVFKDNVFGRHFRYGPVQAVGPGTIFDASNVWFDDGQPVRTAH
jgi:hypothetical protein